jgi:hypothetical protein
LSHDLFDIVFTSAVLDVAGALLLELGGAFV